MHRLGATPAHRIEDRRNIQIALASGGRPDRPCLVGELDVQSVSVGLRIDRDGRDPEAARGADHAAGDFPPIGDQDLAEQAHIRKTPKRVGSPGKPKTGALRLAEIARARASLVSTGSMTPSS